MSADKFGSPNWTTRVVGVCPTCHGAIWQKYGPGRRKRYCKNACRQQAYRERRFAKMAKAFNE